MVEPGSQDTAIRALEIGNAVALRADAEGRVRAALGACEPLLGRRADELAGQLLAETLEPEAWAHLEAAWPSLDGNPETAFEIELGPAEQSRQTRWHTLRVGADDLVLFAADVTSRRKRAEALRRLVDRLPLLIAYVDSDLRYRYGNRAHRRHFAGDDAVVRGRTMPEVLGPETFARVRPYIEKALAGEVSGHRLSLPTVSGATIDTRTEYLPDVADDGGVRGFYVVVQDVTEYRSTIDLMRAAHRVTARQDANVEEMITELLDLGSRHFGMPIALVGAIDRDRYRIEHVGAEAAGAGLEPGQGHALDATCCRNLADSDDVFDFHDGPPADACSAHPGSGDTPPAAYIGAPLLVRGSLYGSVSFAGSEARAAPFTEIDRELARLLAGAISGLIARAQYEAQLEAANERLLLEASTDALTGVYSRRFIDEFLEREVEIANRHGRALAIVMIDLDHFKDVNDSHGHQGGDRILRHVAAACSDELRQSDVLARFGGEEFILMLPETTLAVARRVAERLRARVEALAPEVEPGGDTVTLTASFGIAGLRAGEGTRDIVQRADRALYRAKRKGRNRVESA